MGGPCGTYWEEARCVQGFVGKTEGKRQLAKATHRWNVNIIKVITERSWEGKDGNDLA
jgi:hypothetical protein